MDEEHLKNRIQDLENELNSIRKSKKKKNELGKSFLKNISRVIITPKLQDSIYNSLSEYSEGKLSKETLSELVANIIWRFTRIGFFLIFISLLPATFLLLQTILLNNQNKMEVVKIVYTKIS